MRGGLGHTISRRALLLPGLLLAMGLVAAPAPAATDLCPDTPKRAKALISGCAAVDVVRRPDTFATPLDERLADAADSMPPLQASARSSLVRARRSVAEAAHLMARGRVCPSERSYREALATLRSAQRKLLRALPSQGRRAEASSAAPFGDVSEGEMQAIALGLGPAALQDAIRTLTKSLRAFAGPCDRAEPLSLRRATGRLDDAGRVLRQPGRTLALAKGLNTRVFTGGRGQLTGVSFGDGTGVVTGAKVVAGRRAGRAVSVDVPSDLTLNCIDLRVVPFAWPNGTGRPLHDLRGYESGGQLWLEQGMELAADELCAGTTREEGVTTVHTNRALRLTLKYTRYGGGIAHDTVTTTLAQELTEADADVSLPADMAPFLNGVLTVTELVRTCVGKPFLVIGKTGEKVFGEKISDACAVKELGSQSYLVNAVDTGDYATLAYQRTAFELDTVAGDACQLVSVNDKELHPAVPSDARFEAEAWAGSSQNGCTSARPALTTVRDNGFFAVHLVDPVPVALSQEERLRRHGVRTLSGLTWPRVLGERDGHAFSYAATPPRIDRDRISDCPTGGPGDPRANLDTYHRAPFEPGSGTWRVSQGNRDDPGNYVGGDPANGPIFSDFDGDGDTDEPYHGDQVYEWDLVNDSNGDNVVELEHPIRASRAGWIALLDRDEQGNAGTGRNEEAGWPTATNPFRLPDPDNVVNYKEVGNYVWIRHSDGTYTTYNHLRYNTVPQKFKVGSWVRRGEVIAKNGNTGSSSAPHLHYGSFQVTSIPAENPTKYYSPRPSFWQDRGHTTGCWVPREREFVDSNNELIDVGPFFGLEDGAATR